MSRRSETIAPDYFDDLYRADPDPWGFRTSAYEREKYQSTLDALSRPRYPRGLEVGCAIGVLTRQLAGRCDHLLALDASAVALESAQAECAGVANVTFDCRMVPAGFPAGHFDLILLSEVLYYLTPADLETVAAQCCAALAPGGEIVLCHWLGETDYPLSGRDASERFLRAALKQPLTHMRLKEDAYLLERLQAPSDLRPAGAEGALRRA